MNAQQFNNWVFPYNNGLTFNTNPPSFFGGTQISSPLPPPYSTTFSTAASISDNNGQLLFYSEGVRVWNKNNQVMPNGTGLLGRLGQINTALIIPFINDPFKYYLFTAQGLAAYPLPDTNKYCYSIIDMQLDGGLGDVVNKNTVIQFFAAEKMVAAPHANGNDIWWIGRDWTNHFYSYKITCQGFQNSNPVISTVGNNVNNNLNVVGVGDIKVSPDGKYIAVAYGLYFEIYQFNNTTGILSNAIKIPTEFCYGVEFSPNSKFLYISQNFTVIPYLTADITQYNLSNYDSTQISNSLIKVSNSRPAAGIIYQGGLQLGQDNKIYHCGVNNPNISVINKPDNLGLASNFQDSVILLPNPAWRRFPYCYVNLISSQNVQISYIVAPDCRTVTFTGKTYIKGNNLTFKWQWGEPPPVAGTPLDSATQVVASQGDTTYTTITHTYPLGQDTFFVHLTVTSDTLCGTGRAGKKVIVKPPRPTANFGFAAACSNLTVAFTDSSLLNSNPSITYEYAWKPALAPPTAYTNYSTQPNNSFTFTAYDSFDVRLIVTSALSCVPQDTIIKRVILKAKPVAGCNAVTTCGSLQASFTSSATVTPGTVTQQQYYVGNTLIGTGASFTYSFAAYGSYTVKQVVKSNFNCISDTFLLPVIIKDKPVVNLVTARDSVCINSSYTITANATVNASTINSYVWIKDNVLLANNTNSLTETNPTGTYVYKLVVSSAQGCPSDTAVKTITVVSKPTSGLNAINNCGSKQIAITSSATVVNDNISNHYINYGDGNTSFVDPNNTTYTYANYGTYNLKYVAKSSVGCESDTAYQTIVVKDKPQINFISPPRDSVCNNSSYTITANATVTATTITSYVWLKDNIVLANNTNTLTETNPTGTYVYKLVATSAQGCPSDTAVKTITVVSKPTVTVNAINNCGSKQIAITSTAAVVNDNITNHYISYGDGNTSAINPNNTTYTYVNYGTYNLKYVAKSSVGCESDTAYQTIVVKDKPQVNFTIPPRDSICNGSSFTITANATVNASTITNYVWLKDNVVLANNTNTLTETNPTGIYTYKLVATSAEGCPSDTAVKIITVVSKPTSGLNAVNNCGSKSITITASGLVTNDVISNHYLIYGDGNTSAINPNTTTYTYANYGIYNLKYAVQSSIGCASDTAYQTIAVKDKPVASISYGNNACTNTNYVLTGNASVNAANISSYRWFKNGVLLPVNSSALTENNPAGSYTYKLVVSSNQGCISDTAVQLVLVDNRPTASFTAGSTCVGKAITIANNSVPNNPSVTYLWTTSEGQTSTDLIPAFIFNSSGSKTILLKVSSPNGSCVDNSSQTITIDAYPVAAFDIVEACLGKPLLINNNSTGIIASYTWQTNNAQQSNAIIPQFLFDTAGNYSIKLDVATANNCSATLTKTTPIQPVVLVTRPAVDSNVNVNQPVQLSITGAATYAWQPFTNLSNAAVSNPVFKSGVLGIYPLTVQATTAQGCKATASLTIKVFDGGDYLLVPNAFTPNGDGKNDQFSFTCAGLRSLTFFRVYNRYGQTVYQQNNCNNIGWDGTFKGKAQPGGAYVYNWQGVAFNGQMVSGSGSVILVR